MIQIKKLYTNKVIYTHDGDTLKWADLEGADLEGVKLDDTIPVVENLDAKILEAIEAGGMLDMASWHLDGACGTTHCRAGWAITIAGKAGAELENRFGPQVAGALIYVKSTGKMPNFFDDDETAMADIKRCAGK